MQISYIDGFNALCEAKGVQREVSLYLSFREKQVAIGDFVMVHVGYAIQKMNESEARSAWELHEEFLASEAGSGNRKNLPARLILTEVERVALKNGVLRVQSVKLRIGPLSGVETRLLQHAYPFASAGTLAEGSKLEDTAGRW